MTESASNLQTLLATGELLNRAQAGDRQAIDVLLSRYRRPLENLLHLRLDQNTRRLFETQDLVQEVLTRALTLLPQFRYQGVGSFWSYLRVSALNHVREVTRRSLRGGPAAPLNEETMPSDGTAEPTPLAEMCWREEFRTFEMALDRLPERARQAMLMRLELELPYDRIASECGFASPDAARMAIVRAIKQVSREVGRDQCQP